MCGNGPEREFQERISRTAETWAIKESDELHPAVNPNTVNISHRRAVARINAEKLRLSLNVSNC
jgi:hypothetical protein